MARLSGTLLAAMALAYPALATRQFSFRLETHAATRPSSGHALSENVVPLRKTGRAGRSATYLRSIRASGGSPVSNYSSGYEDVDNLGNTEYVALIDWAGTPVEVILDTGSSDTWLIQSGFTCVDADGKPQSSEADCGFGPPINGTFTKGSIAHENFNISYGDGEFITGVWGYEDITVAGITVKSQQVALGNYSYWFGDNVTSGLIGLAYAGLTSAFSGDDPKADRGRNLVEYSPIMTTMINQSLIDPVFSLAVDRGSGDGYLALGGLPPVNYTGSFAATPILTVSIYDYPTQLKEHTFYTIVADAYVYEGSGKNHTKGVNSTQFPIIVDSGTSLLYLPTELVNDIWAAYDPPATYFEDLQIAYALCNASVPSVGVQINGTVLYINEADLLLQNTSGEDTDWCMTGPQDGQTGPYILGDTFMNNVISVFDIGANEMRFAARDY